MTAEHYCDQFGTLDSIHQAIHQGHCLIYNMCSLRASRQCSM